MDTIGKYQRQINKLKTVIEEDEDPNLARRHQKQLDEALTNLENATTAYAKCAVRQSARIAKLNVRTLPTIISPLSINFLTHNCK